MGRPCCEAAGGLGNKGGWLISQQHGPGPGWLDSASLTACSLCSWSLQPACLCDLGSECQAVGCRGSTCTVHMWVSVLLTCFFNNALNLHCFLYLSAEILVSLSFCCFCILLNEDFCMLKVKNKMYLHLQSMVRCSFECMDAVRAVLQH